MADQNKSIVGAEVRGTVVDKEELQSLLGEGIHTGLRKGSDDAGAPALWDAISAAGPAWSDGLAYAIWGLRYMGYDIVRVVD